MMSHLAIQVKRFWRTEKWENTGLALDTDEVTRAIRERDTGVMEVFPEADGQSWTFQLCGSLPRGVKAEQ